MEHTAPTFRTPVALAGAVCAALPAFAQQGTPGAHFVQNWDADGNGQVTAGEARARRADVFLAFDADGNGRVSCAEFLDHAAGWVANIDASRHARS